MRVLAFSIFYARKPRVAVVSRDSRLSSFSFIYQKDSKTYLVAYGDNGFIISFIRLEGEIMGNSYQVKGIEQFDVTRNIVLKSLKSGKEYTVFDDSDILSLKLESLESRLSTVTLGFPA